MTTLEPQNPILDEVLALHLSSQDGQAFLVGQARLERVQVYCAPDNLPNPLVFQLDSQSTPQWPASCPTPPLRATCPLAQSTKPQRSIGTKILPCTNTNHTHTTI